MIDQAEQAYKVSEITSIISGLLEPNLQHITVEGEISNFRPASSGHWYFSLKDQDSLLSAAMFRGSNSRIRFRPSDGMMVRVAGSISVYARRGSYQIICNSMQQAGTGDILAMLEERKQRLADEGLFAPERKQPLPRLPQRIALLTSPSGAAVRDILQVMQRRNAGLHAVIVPCAVQGDAAAAALVQGLKLIEKHKLGDVIILGRGGGSLEDLLPFSDEAVVRAVANCSIPIISAVGHEIDWALSDYAADMRAPTPSAAAEIVTENRDELYRRVIDRGRSIAGVYTHRLSSARALIDKFKPETLQERYAMFQQPFLQRLDDAKEQLLSAFADRCSGYRQRIQLAQVSLDAMSPYAVLQRGYAILRDGQSNAVIASIDQSPATDHPVQITLTDGNITAVVRTTERNHNEKKL